MGGRGASSGTSKKGNAYGSQYHSVLVRGNVKYVEKNSKDAETLMETMTPGRVYAVIDRGEIKSIVYFDSENKRSKQIDLRHQHGGMSPHTHHGYLHNELDSKKGASRLTDDERIMVDRVVGDWASFRQSR